MIDDQFLESIIAILREKYGMPVEKWEIWLAVPCVCRPCAIVNTFAKNAVYCRERMGEGMMIFCRIHGVLGYFNGDTVTEGGNPFAKPEVLPAGNEAS